LPPPKALSKAADVGPPAEEEQAQAGLSRDINARVVGPTKREWSPGKDFVEGEREKKKSQLNPRSKSPADDWDEE